MRMFSLRILTLLALYFLCSREAEAQFTEPVDSTQYHVLPDPSMSEKYFVPDIPKKWLKWSQFEGKAFSMRIGFAPIVDYVWNGQDNESKEQVGEQESRFDLRSGRMTFSGDFKFSNPLNYFLSVEYKGFDRGPEDPPFGVTDLSLSIHLNKILGKFTIGKIKETFVYEMVGDAANLPFTERILNPFFQSRSIGIKLMNGFYDERMTFAVGWFNDWFVKDVSFDDNGNQFTARLTGLPIYQEKGKKFLHLGISSRYNQAAKNLLRYRGRNESNISSYYVDTKDIPADHSWSVGLEGLWSYRNFSFLSEYVQSWASTYDHSNPSFNGFYMSGSWVISSEQRPYDKKAAYARRVMPTGTSGAWELVARYSRLDMNDKQIEGGILNKLYLGLNWWATQHWRMSLGYGLSNLDKLDLKGTTNTITTRLQWIY